MIPASSTALSAEAQHLAKLQARRDRRQTPEARAVRAEAARQGWARRHTAQHDDNGGQ